MVRLLLVVLLIGCSVQSDEAPGGEDSGDVQPDPRTLVEVAEAAPGSVGSHLVASATVESEVQATLVAEASGVVTALHAEEGDEVRRGQLLAVIASPQLDAAYERASAELERARTEAEAAERLFGQNAVSRAEVDAARQALAIARTAHSEASATRGFTRLLSPIDGVVAQRNVRYGEVAGPTPAFVIVDPARLRVVVNLPERDLPRVRPGLPATLVSAYSADVTARGTLERIAPVVDAATGTFRATLRLDADTPLRPGQFVSVRVEVDRHEGVLTVPRRALVWEEGKAYVFRVSELTAEDEAKEKEAEEKAKKAEEKGGFAFSFGEPDEEKKPAELPGPKRKAVRVAVQVGYEDGELAEITSGLAAGDPVVVVGNQALRDGARVRLPGDPTVASAAPPQKDG